jgi:hypothetical protein
LYGINQQVKQSIIIKGGSYEKVKRVLRQWMRLYRQELEPTVSFDLKRISRGNHLIVINKQISNDLFFFLVNYLEYPEDIVYSVDIKGYTIGTKSPFSDKIIQVFVNSDDTDFDNVHIVTHNNECYKADFSGNISKENPTVKFEELDEFSPLPTEVLHLPKESISKTELDLSRINRRFKIITLIWFIGLITNFILPQFHTDFSTKYTMAFGMLFGFWFLYDYNMLRIPKYYFYSLGLSVIMFISGQLLEFFYPYILIKNEGWFLPSFGLSLLLTQYPLRKLFLFLFKREPIVDRNEGWLNSIYSIILMLSMLFISFISWEQLNH